MTKLPRLIFNTDGNWMLFYLPDRNPDDVTHQLDELVPAEVDALAGLIGIDDDVVWRGSPHSAMWGDDTEVWDPDPDVDADGKPIRKMTVGGFELNRLLIGLDGLQTPDPWPTLHQCEAMVLGCDSA